MVKNDSHNAPSPQLPRHAPEIGRLEAEKVMHESLAEAFRLVSQGGKSTREGIMLALDAVTSVLSARGISGQQLQPLIMLRQELEHIWQGNRSQILQPQRKEDGVTVAYNRFTGPGKQSLKLYATACAEAVYRNGRNPDVLGFDKLTRTQADQRVARSMRSWPTFDKQEVSGRTVKGWRDEMTLIDEPEVRRAQWNQIVADFTSGKRGFNQLNEVLKNGPPLTGGLGKKLPGICDPG